MSTPDVMNVANYISGYIMSAHISIPVVCRVRKVCLDATAIASQQAVRPGRTSALTELQGYGYGTN